MIHINLGCSSSTTTESLAKTGKTVDELRGSKKALSLLWAQFKVFRYSLQANLNLSDKLRGLVVNHNDIYLLSNNYSVSLESFIQVGTHHIETIASLTSLIEAVAELHAQGIIHRNIKPENFVINQEGCTSAFLLNFQYAASVND